MFANIGVDANQSRWLRNRIFAVHLNSATVLPLRRSSGCLIVSHPNDGYPRHGIGFDTTRGHQRTANYRTWASHYESETYNCQRSDLTPALLFIVLCLHAKIPWGKRISIHKIRSSTPEPRVLPYREKSGEKFGKSIEK